MESLPFPADERSDVFFFLGTIGMRCPICKTAELPEDGLLQAVCDGCIDVELPKKKRQEPLPEVTFAKRPKRRRRGESDRTKTPSPPPSSAQTIESARAVARAWRQQIAGALPESTSTKGRTLRFDTAHRSNDTATRTAEPTRLESQNRLRSVRSSVNFGLFVLLAGQGLMLAAQMSEQSSAWFIGLLLSIGGLTQSILSLNEGLRQIEERIASLASSRTNSKPD